MLLCLFEAVVGHAASVQKIFKLPLLRPWLAMQHACRRCSSLQLFVVPRVGACFFVRPERGQVLSWFLYVSVRCLLALLLPVCPKHVVEAQEARSINTP